MAVVTYSHIAQQWCRDRCARGGRRPVAALDDASDVVAVDVAVPGAVRDGARAHVAAHDAVDDAPHPPRRSGAQAAEVAKVVIVEHCTKPSDLRDVVRTIATEEVEGTEHEPGLGVRSEHSGGRHPLEANVKAPPVAEVHAHDTVGAGGQVDRLRGNLRGDAKEVGSPGVGDHDGLEAAPDLGPRISWISGTLRS